MITAAQLARDHPRHVLVAALAIGIALARTDPLTLFALAGLSVSLLTACRVPAHVALAAAALLMAGAGAGQERLQAIDADPLAHANPTSGLTAHVVAQPRITQNGYAVRIHAIDPRGDQQVELRSRGQPPPGLRIGRQLLVTGRLSAVDPRTAHTPAGRSYARFLLRQGVRRRVDARSVQPTGGSRGGAAGLIDGMRIRAEDALAFGLAPEPAALLRGMVLGGDAGLAEATAEDFRVAGLSHILAVSGQNVLLIVILVNAILMVLGAARLWRLVIPAGVVVVYVALCGAHASVIRAGAMGLAALAALAASRPTSRVYALLLGAIAVLAINPRATADVGAQLSFAAVTGIMAFTNPFAARMQWLPSWAAEALAATCGATIATAPLMAHHFGAVSVVSLAVNVIAAPLIGPIVWLGSLTAALGQVSLPLGALLGAPNAFLLGALTTVAHIAAMVPGAQMQTGGFGIAELVASFAALGIIGLWLNGHLTSLGRAWRSVAGSAPWPRGQVPRRRRSRRSQPGRVLLCIALVAVARLALRPAPPPLRGPAVVMLDVGQGDATLVVGSSGCTALIDGGSPGQQLEDKLRRLGVRQLDALVATHAEDDHFGGLLELADASRIRVGTFIDGGGNTSRPDYARLRQELQRRGAQRLAATTGSLWRCGDLTIRLLGPQPQPPGAPPPASPNDRAAVTLIDAGQLRMLASGDAESSALAALAVPPVDVLKVAHHGSADPGLADLLSRLRPHVALIGVGAYNRYGHPTPQVMNDLAGAGVRVLRTDRDGQIVVRPGSAGAPSIAAGGDR